MLQLAMKMPAREFLHNVMHQLCYALTDLHHTGVIHNDLKLDNVMVEVGRSYDDLRVRIIDFGMATLEGEAPYHNIPYWRIKRYPQIDPRLSNGGSSSTSTDLYSLGQMLMLVSRIH